MPPWMPTLTPALPSRPSPPLTVMASWSPPDPLRQSPRRDELIDCLPSSAAALEAHIHASTPVEAVTSSDGDGFMVTTGAGAAFTAPRVIADTGSFCSPFVPTVPGQGEFGGEILHASEY